jgi:hypothetical protein
LGKNLIPDYKEDSTNGYSGQDVFPFFGKIRLGVKAESKWHYERKDINPEIQIFGLQGSYYCVSDLSRLKVNFFGSYFLGANKNPKAWHPFFECLLWWT